MVGKITDFNPGELLRSDDEIEIFLNGAFDTEDARLIASALGIALRAKGMTNVAREQLYKSLSENDNPTLETLLAVMKSIGFRLEIRRAA